MLSIRDKCIVTAVVLTLTSCGLYMLGYVPMAESKAEQKAKILELSQLPSDKTGLDSKYQSLVISNDSLDTQLNESKNLKAQTSKPKKEEFLSYISKGLNDNDLKMSYFYDLSYETKNIKSRFTFDVKGRLENVTAFCKYLDSLNIKYSVGDFSIRQDLDLGYLNRDFNGVSKLSWFDDRTELADETDIVINKEPEKVVEAVETEPTIEDDVSDDYIVEDDAYLDDYVDTEEDESLSSIEDRLNYLFDLDRTEEVDKPKPVVKIEPKPTQKVEEVVVKEEPKVEEKVEGVTSESSVKELLYKLTIILEY